MHAGMGSENTRCLFNMVTLLGLLQMKFVMLLWVSCPDWVWLYCFFYKERKVKAIWNNESQVFTLAIRKIDEMDAINDNVTKVLKVSVCTMYGLENIEIWIKPISDYAASYILQQTIANCWGKSRHVTYPSCHHTEQFLNKNWKGAIKLLPYGNMQGIHIQQQLDQMGLDGD